MDIVVPLRVAIGFDCSQHYRKSNGPVLSRAPKATDPYLKVTLARDRCPGHARVGWLPFEPTVMFP